MNYLIQESIEKKVPNVYRANNDENRYRYFFVKGENTRGGNGKSQNELPTYFLGWCQQNQFPDFWRIHCSRHQLLQ